MEEQQDIINQNQCQTNGAYNHPPQTISRSHSISRRSVISDGSGSGVHWKIFNQNRHRAAFIRDLPFHCTSDDLRKFICITLPSLASSLEEVTVRYGQHGKSLQVAGVLFRDEESATTAIEQLHGQRYEGRDLRVSSYNPQAQMETSKVAEIRFSFTSLSQTMQRITEAIIREGFEREFGPLQDVGIRLHRVSSDGTQTGYGFMTFQNPEHNRSVAENCRGYDVNQIHFECSWSSQHGQSDAVDGYDEVASSTPRSQPLSRNASYSRYSSSSVSPIPSSDAAVMSSASGYPLPIPVASGHPTHIIEGDTNLPPQYMVSSPPPNSMAVPYNNHVHMVSQQVPVQHYMIPPPTLTTSSSYVSIPPSSAFSNLPPNLPSLPPIMTFHPHAPTHHVPVQHVLPPASNTLGSNATSSNNQNSSNPTRSFTPAASTSNSVVATSGYYAPQPQYMYGSQVPSSPSNSASSIPSSAPHMVPVSSPNVNLVNPFQFQSPVNYHHYFYNGYPPSVATTQTSNLVPTPPVMHDQHPPNSNSAKSMNSNQHNNINHGSNSNSNHGIKNHGDSLQGIINSNSGDLINHDINHGVDHKISNSPKSTHNVQHPSYNHTQITSNHQYNSNNINNTNDISKNGNHYSTQPIAPSNTPDGHTLAAYHSQSPHHHVQTQQILSSPPITQYYQAYNPHLATHPAYSLSVGYGSQQQQQQTTVQQHQQQQPGNLVYVYYPNSNNNANTSNTNNNPSTAHNAVNFTQPVFMNNMNGTYPSSSFQQQPPNFHHSH